MLLLKEFHEYSRSKTPRCVKLNHSSEMENDDTLMHREGLKGLKKGFKTILVMIGS